MRKSWGEVRGVEPSVRKRRRAGSVGWRWRVLGGGDAFVAGAVDLGAERAAR